MAVKVNLIVDQGSSFSASVTVQDTTESTIDLTGFTGASQLRKHFSSANSTAFTVTLGGIEGTVALSMNAATTNSLVAGRYVYDVELTSSSNVVSRVVEGIVTITPSVTR